MVALWDSTGTHNHHVFPLPWMKSVVGGIYISVSISLFL
jgi:hypothetical protein